MNELTPLQKKFFKILVEEWGDYESCRKPQGCDWHKIEQALYEAMAVYIHFRHNGVTIRAHDYNINRNTARKILANIGINHAEFKDRLTAKSRLGV